MLLQTPHTLTTEARDNLNGSHGLTVVAGVGATDGRWITPSLSSGLKVINTAGAAGASVET